MVVGYGPVRKRKRAGRAKIEAFLAKTRGARENASAGEVAEWSNAAVLKICVARPSGYESS